MSKANKNNIVKDILKQDFNIDDPKTYPFKDLSDYKDQDSIYAKNIRGNIRLQIGKFWTRKEINEYKNSVFNKPIPR